MVWVYIHEEVFREMNPRCTVQSNVSLSRPNHWLHTQHSELSHLFSTLFGVFNLAIPSLEWLFSKHWNCTLMSQHTVAYSACNHSERLLGWNGGEGAIFSDSKWIIHLSSWTWCAYVTGLFYCSLHLMCVIISSIDVWQRTCVPDQESSSSPVAQVKP